MRDRSKYMKAYHRRWYETVVVRRRKEWFAANGPCVDCGSWENLELDHDDPSTKISHAVWTWTLERRQAELAKCKARCKSCHLKKTVCENALRDIWVPLRKVPVQGKLQCTLLQTLAVAEEFYEG